MSKIAISSNASGAATFTIASPATGTNRTLTLPDADGTVLSIDSAGAVNNTTGIVNLGSGQVYKDALGVLLLGATAASTTQAKIELHSAANAALSLYMFKATQVEVTIGFKSSTDTNFYIGSGSASVGTNGVYLTNTGSSWTAVSDERVKTIVEPIQNASAKVATLRAVIGYYNNDEQKTRRPFLIAQDVQAVLPEAVSIANQELGTLGMAYTEVIPLLVAALKEQQALAASLTARITALEGTKTP